MALITKAITDMNFIIQILYWWISQAMPLLLWQWWLHCYAIKQLRLDLSFQGRWNNKLKKVYSAWVCIAIWPFQILKRILNSTHVLKNEQSGCEELLIRQGSEDCMSQWGKNSAEHEHIQTAVRFLMQWWSRFQISKVNFTKSQNASRLVIKCMHHC